MTRPPPYARDGLARARRRSFAPMGYCGLDFGTSNTTLGIAAGNAARLVPLESTETTLPSAIFFDFADRHFQQGYSSAVEHPGEDHRDHRRVTARGHRRTFRRGPRRDDHRLRSPR